MKNNRSILVVVALILASSVIACKMFGGSNSNGISTDAKKKGPTATAVCQMLAHPDFEDKSPYDGKNCSGNHSFGAGASFSYFVASDNDTIQMIRLIMSGDRPEVVTFFVAEANAVAKMINGEPLPEAIEKQIKYIGAASKITREIGHVNVEFERYDTSTSLTFEF